MTKSNGAEIEQIKLTRENIRKMVRKKRKIKWRRGDKEKKIFPGDFNFIRIVGMKMLGFVFDKRGEEHFFFTFSLLVSRRCDVDVMR